MSVIHRGGLLVVTKPPENMQKNWVMCKYSSNLCYSFKLKSETLKLRLSLKIRPKSFVTRAGSA